jgi:3-oxoacyl-[acyl-carrier protein] reductase
MNSKSHHALVTGATRGIGYAIAERLLEDGLSVTVTGTRSDAKYPAGANYYPIDFIDKKSINNFIEYIKRKNIDILINNAGINKIGEFSSIDMDDFDRILHVNLRTPFQLCQAVIPYMKKNEWGRIINITSVFGNITKKYRASYSSSKFALDGMTASLAAEVSEFGILANCIGPGFIDTDLTRAVLGKEGIAEIKKTIPMNRLGRINEIASLVSWMVSEENTYISGQNLMIDGGFSRV